MSDSRNRDFDAAHAALRPIRFKLKGREYDLGPDPSCDGLLQLLREGRVTNTFRPVDGEATIALLEALMGADNLARARADGMGIAMLSDLLDWLVEQIVLSRDATESLQISKLRDIATILAVTRGADDPAVGSLVAAIAELANDSEDIDEGNGSGSPTLSSVGGP